LCAKLATNEVQFFDATLQKVVHKLRLEGIGKMELARGALVCTVAAFIPSIKVGGGCFVELFYRFLKFLVWVAKFCAAGYAGECASVPGAQL
jgi:hypothetical protein